jgi:type I restriction enzyme S subunit
MQQIASAKQGYKQTKLGEIPEEWSIKTLGEVLDVCQYGLSLSLSHRGEYPIFRMNNIENGHIVANEMKFIDLDKSVFERYKLEKGDLLFNRTNSYDLVGKIGVFILDGDYTFASYLIRLRTKEEIINPFFLNFYLNTNWIQYNLKSIATAGVSQTNINAENLKSLTIPILQFQNKKKLHLFFQK